MVLLFGGVVGVYWSQFRGYGILASAAGVLVLEDSDSDFRTPPFEDAVLLFGSDGKTLRKINDLNICQTVGGCRSLSMAMDGRFLTVCVASIITPPFEFGHNTAECFFFAFLGGLFSFPVMFAVVLLPLRWGLRRLMPHRMQRAQAIVAG
jgi:hypothetical protein